MSSNGTKEISIDESLYSRQLYVLGHDAMKRMAESNVLIVGVGALGIEIAKNIILAGVKSVSLSDPTPTSLSDLSAQFYLSEDDIGKSRALCSAPKLSLLNQYVPVSCIEGDLTPEKISQFQVVIVTEMPLSRQIEINNYTHQNNIKFIAADIRGLFGMSFCDFGTDFKVSDSTGESPVSGIIAAVSKDFDGVVTGLEDSRHNLEDGDFVSFSEVRGMTELNESGPFKITVLSPQSFKIGDTSQFKEYESGGIFTQVKMPKTLNFKSLEESLSTPDFFISDFAKFDRPAQLHFGFQALDSYMLQHGELPSPRNQKHAEEIVFLAQKLAAQSDAQFQVDKELIQELTFQSRGILAPMAAVIGGLVAQEALKGISGKFHPIHQYFYFDSLESFPKNISVTEESCQPISCRYDSQIAVFGQEFQQILANSNQFLVGSGAIGCEMLKNWAMMGLGVGPNGKTTVTDMDTIEKSNLNRQFLFRSKDVGKSKSLTAIQAITVMNRDMVGKVEARLERVGIETEEFFDDSFFEKLTLVTNALDNVEARTYMDRRCIYYRKPLLESGTSGTKGNTQVVIPHLTESYSSSQDPPEKSIPMCTLKNFPNAIEHTIQWARDLFAGVFTQLPENCNLYLRNPENARKSIKQGGIPKDTLKDISDSLGASKPKSFQDCVAWARLQFQELYHNTIAQLLFNFPPDTLTSTGAPFWSGPKRVPTPLIFNPQDPLHLNFIVAAANLRAYNFNIIGFTDVDRIQAFLQQVEVPEFIPKSGVKIQVNENEPVSNGDAGNDTELSEIIERLPVPDGIKKTTLNAVEFEKDDDSNHHIDFVTAASNLRARNYSISEVDRHATKGIAGKIIPAIATTTSLVTGLVCLELYKVLDGLRPIEDYKNGFINLALPFFGFSEPIKAAELKYMGKTFTHWDRFDIDENLKLKELLEYFKNEHGIVLSMLSMGNSMLYSSYIPQSKIKDRLGLKISDLAFSISKKALAPHVKYAILEVMGEDLEGNDIEDLPYVRIKVRD